MKRLMVVRTPYQLIVSLYLQEQLGNDGDIFGIVIYETFSNADIILKRIKDKNIFDKFYFIDRKVIGKYVNSDHKFGKLFSLLNYKTMINKIFDKIDIYDEMYYWNIDDITENMKAYFYKNNMKFKNYIFEEGYISYFPQNELSKSGLISRILEFRNKLIGLPNIKIDNVFGYYFFYPELIIFNTDKDIFKIDTKISETKEFKNKINYIFNVNDIYEKYDKKYIIFDEAIFANSNEFDDEKVIMNIVDKVGKENVIIKLHPRTKKDRFSDKGIKTLGSDGMPWEAITLSNDFSDKIFIAIGSGSIINYRLTFGKNMKGILLFKILDTNFKQYDKKYNKFWNQLESHYPESGIYMPKTMKELDDILDKIKGE